MPPHKPVLCEVHFLGTTLQLASENSFVSKEHGLVIAL